MSARVKRGLPATQRTKGSASRGGTPVAVPVDVLRRHFGL